MLKSLWISLVPNLVVPFVLLDFKGFAVFTVSSSLIEWFFKWPHFCVFLWILDHWESFKVCYLSSTTHFLKKLTPPLKQDKAKTM